MRFGKPRGSSFRRLSGALIDSDEWRGTVVLLHGIDGHPQKSFASHRLGKQWYEQLTDTLPGLGCYSYPFGYSRARSENRRERLLESYSEGFLGDLRTSGLLDKPLYFIAHSLGGILGKRVVADMANYDATYFNERSINLGGMVFLGVPHGGSPWASNVVMRSVFAPSVTAADLAPGSRVLEDVHKRFMGTCKDRPSVRILSVHETLPPTAEEFMSGRFSGAAQVFDRAFKLTEVVPYQYSHLDVGEECTAIASHLGIASFDYPNANDIISRIRSMIRTKIAEVPYQGDGPWMV